MSSDDSSSKKGGPPGRGRGRGQKKEPAAESVGGSSVLVGEAESTRPASSLSFERSEATGPVVDRRAVAVVVGPPPAARGARQAASAQGRPEDEVSLARLVISEEPEETAVTEKRLEPGTLGRKIKLRSNYFRVECRGKLEVMQYQVDYYIVEQDGHTQRSYNRDDSLRMFWTAIRNNPEVFTRENDRRGISLVYDSQRWAFSLERIKFPPTANGNGHGNGNGNGHGNGNGNGANGNGNGNGNGGRVFVHPPQPGAELVGKLQLQLTFLGTATVDFSQMTSLVNSKRDNLSLQLIEVIFKNHLMFESAEEEPPRFVSAVRSFYSVPRDIGRGLGMPFRLDTGKELWKGFYAATNILSEKQLMLNVDMTGTIFYKCQNLLDLLCEIAGKHGARITPDTIGNYFPDATVRMALANFLNNIKVEVIHRRKPEGGGRPAAQRPYKCLRMVSDKSARDLSFDVRQPDGTTTQLSVADYFANKYTALRYPQLPCIRVHPKTRWTWLPLEVCVIRYGQRVPMSQKMNEQISSGMIREMAKPAPDREKIILDLFRQADFINDPCARAFGLKVQPNQVAVDGRVLEPPKLEYGNPNRPEIPRNGAWKLGERFYRPAMVKQWVLMSFVPQREVNKLERFCKVLSDCAHSMGVTSMPQWPICVYYIRTGRNPAARDLNMEYEFQNVMEDLRVKNIPLGDVDLWVVAMERKDPYRYSEVKRIAEIKFGYMTQCAIMKTIEQCSPQTIQNLMLKINTKCGGINSKLVATQTIKHFLQDKPCLVMGIDVTHPAPFDEKSPSVGAVVANTDNIPARFCSQVVLQKQRREHVVSLGIATNTMLRAYYQESQAKPERIIVFRDGVADSQFDAVLKEELSSIREACTRISGKVEKYQPKITYIVAQKNHHVRFFCGDPRDELGKSRNIPPGTVVDTMVVHPFGHDFFLCSHAGIQGTSRPIRYNVLHNENRFSTDELQILAYNLCHVFARCARTVKVPGPVYYADLVATRARIHLRHLVGGDSPEQSEAGSQPGSSKPGAKKDGDAKDSAKESSAASTSSAGAKSKKSGSDSIPEHLLNAAIKVHTDITGKMYYV